MIGAANRYTDWGSWLEQKSWYGGAPYQEIVAAAKCGLTFQEWFSQFFKDDDKFGNWYAPVLDAYDDQLECWQFMIYGFAENFNDYVSAVNVLRQLDSIGDGKIHGQFVIVPFAFGLGFIDVEVVVTIDNKNSMLNVPARDDFELWAAGELKAASQADR